MQTIPVKEARKIAEKYGYDQVIIHARKMGEDVTAALRGESMATYGVNAVHDTIIARIGKFIQESVFGWQK